MTIRRSLLIGLPALALLGIGHGAYWAWAAASLEDGIARWTAQQRAAGWRVEASPPTRGGWPVRASVTVGAVRLAGADATLPGGLSWQADGLALSVDLAAPGTLHLRAAGRQAVRAGSLPETSFTAAGFDLSIPLIVTPSIANPSITGADTWMELRATGIDLAVNGHRASVANLLVRAEFRPAAPAGEPSATFTVQAGPAKIPAELAPELGPTIETLALTLALRGKLPATPEASRRAVAAWRDGSGRLDLSSLRLRWGRLDLGGEASLSLDSQLQPAGRGRSRITGQDAVLDALARADLLPRQLAASAKAILGLAARPTGPGGAPEVDIPFTLRDRTLAVGQFPIARLAPLAWPPP